MNLPHNPSPDLREKLLAAIRVERDRRECVSLAEFVKRSWHILEPETELQWGWALDAICDHLEAVTDGRIRRLLINCPPGLMKSLLVGVFWPAWEWGPKGMSHLKYVSTSHQQDLAIRDARKMRLIIESDWYQERWPMGLAADANAKTYFENDGRGFRSSTAFTGMTGKRGDRVILDDPHSVKSGESEIQRKDTITTFREALPSRVNSKASAIVVIMQRLHEDDVSGNILSRRTGYVHLCLPMRFESERRCSTSIGFTDPRTYEGELLFPELYDNERTEELEGELGTYGSAGQLQQRPVPRSGGMFKLSWFDGHYVSDIPTGTRWVRWWDLAASTDKGAAFTAGVLLGKTPQGRYIIGGVNRFQEEYHKRDTLIKDQCAADKARFGSTVKFFIPKDPGAGGKMQWKALVAFLDGYDVRAVAEAGDKEERAGPFSAACEGGNVDILGTATDAWVKAFLDELTIFPGGKWKDQVDAAVNAYGRFIAEPKKKTTWAGAEVLDIPD